MKPVISILISFFSLLISFEKDFNEATVVISQESELTITGFTNINHFSCNYNIYKIDPKQKVLYKTEGDRIIFNQTSLNLSSTAFDCGNKMINKDFNRLLKTEVYPEVKLKLLEIRPNNNVDNKLNAKIEVTICGVANIYEMPVEINHNEKLSVKGILNLDISDFQLKPPKKVLGIIKVDEKINIDFNLFFNKI